ncbi:hypothetical protein TRFO_19827 [Tritrichomonas foetus]|uniref:Initiator binding domain-containing protein n=1 Tax=Tritrichomonas foetus TaxID=1144522 RepID=A0A1J4KN08_9EUKA|nr:hypothetical protein TRFO_19827 [Tritrichomonas foetus]|eukprot:OHT10773.1 hypothetical protein TRFO_19827 [Tritrichomonas foetus]
MCTLTKQSLAELKQPFPERLIQNLQDSDNHPENIPRNGVAWINNHEFIINTTLFANSLGIKKNSVNLNLRSHGIERVRTKYQDPINKLPDGTHWAVCRDKNGLFSRETKLEQAAATLKWMNPKKRKTEKTNSILASSQNANPVKKEYIIPTINLSNDSLLSKVEESDFENVSSPDINFSSSPEKLDEIEPFTEYSREIFFGFERDEIKNDQHEFPFLTINLMEQQGSFEENWDLMFEI